MCNVQGKTGVNRTPSWGEGSTQREEATQGAALALSSAIFHFFCISAQLFSTFSALALSYFLRFSYLVLHQS